MSEKTTSTWKWIAGGLGVAGLGVLTYFGFQHFGNSSSEQEVLQTEEKPKEVKPKAPVKPTAKKKPVAKKPQAPQGFQPIGKGSKGDNVKALQQALINTYGKTILPKQGASGTYTPELAAALTKLGLPDKIDKDTFDVLIKNSKPDTRGIATALAQSTLQRNFTHALTHLSRITTAQDYTAISEQYKNIRHGPVRYQSLLTGMFKVFSNPAQQAQLRLTFRRMGLIYDAAADKWSVPKGLSGLPLGILTTRAATLVYKEGRAIKVPANMVLGRATGFDGLHYSFKGGRDDFKVSGMDVSMQ